MKADFHMQRSNPGCDLPPEQASLSHKGHYSTQTKLPLDSVATLCYSVATPDWR